MCLPINDHFMRKNDLKLHMYSRACSYELGSIDAMDLTHIPIHPKPPRVDGRA